MKCEANTLVNERRANRKFWDNTTLCAGHDELSKSAYTIVDRNILGDRMYVN